MHAVIYVCQDLWPTHMTELATARRIEGWNRTGYPSGPVRRSAQPTGRAYSTIMSTVRLMIDTLFMLEALRLLSGDRRFRARSGLRCASFLPNLDSAVPSEHIQEASRCCVLGETGQALNSGTMGDPGSPFGPTFMLEHPDQVPDPFFLRFSPRSSPPSVGGRATWVEENSRDSREI